MANAKLSIQDLVGAGLEGKELQDWMKKSSTIGKNSETIRKYAARLAPLFMKVLRENKKDMAKVLKDLPADIRATSPYLKRLLLDFYNSMPAVLELHEKKEDVD